MCTTSVFDHVIWFRSEYGLNKIIVVDHRHCLRLLEVSKAQTAKADGCTNLVRYYACLLKSLCRLFCCMFIHA